MYNYQKDFQLRILLFSKLTKAAIASKHPHAKTTERTRTIAGEIKPIILSFLYVFKQKGKDERSIAPQQNKTTEIILETNNDPTKKGKEKAIAIVWIFITAGV